MAKEKQPFTPKQKMFVKEYLIDLNATQAAIRAGYSKKTASEQSSRLLGNVKISEAIKSAIEKRSERTELTMDRVLLEYKRLALLDIRKAFDADGELKPIHELDDDTAAAIAGIESEDQYEGVGTDRKKVGVLRKLKLADKRGALQDVMRHLGGFGKDMLALTTPPDQPIQQVITLKQATDIYTKISKGK